MSVITMPHILEEKLGSQGANALVKLLNNVEDQFKDHTIEVAENKFEKRLTEECRNLETKILGVENRLEVKILELKDHLETKISDVENRLESKISGMESRLEMHMRDLHLQTLRWIFGSAFAQVAVLLSVFALLFKS